MTVTIRPAVAGLAAAALLLTLPGRALAQSEPSPALIRFDGGRYDRAGAIVVDPAGNFYVGAAVETGTSQPSFAVVKFDRNGTRLWRTNYSGSAGGSLGQAFGVGVDSLGNVYAAGYVSVGFHSTVIDALVVKFGANGVEQWARRYNGPAGGPDALGHVVIDAAGNVLVSGYSYGAGIDWLTQKYSPSGALLWERRLSGPGNFDDSIGDVGVDPQGNLVVTGITKNRGDSVTNDITTLKYSPEGAVVWSTTYSTTAVSDDLVFDLAVDAGGGVYLSGAVAPTADPEGPLHVPLTLRYDPAGNLLGTVQEAAPGNGTGVAIDQAGEVYVVTESTLFKYSSALVRIRAVPLIGNLSVPSVLVDSQSRVLIAATVFAPLTFVRDYYTTKLSSSGQTLWAHRFNGTGNRDDVVSGAVVDSADDLLVTGTSWSNYTSSGGTADDIVTFKYLASDQGAPPSPPAAPSKLAGSALSRTQIRLTWTDNSGNETSFTLERCAGNNCTNFAAIAQVGAGVTTFTDNGLTRRTTYRYRVRAVNGAGASQYSNIVSATTAK
jgi:hypothetical protein